MRRLVTYTACLLGLAVLTANAIQPRKARFGQIQDLTLQDSVELQWPAVYGERPTLQEGESFAVVLLTIAAGKSIGKYDYTLSGSKCLAMALPGETFNPETWQQVAQNGALDVQLLYIVDQAGAPYTLSMEYNIPALPDKHITLLEETAPAPAEPAVEDAPPAEQPEVEADIEAEPPAPEEPAAEPEAPPEEQAPAPKPEAKPEPKPDPEPAPKPAPEKEEPEDEVEDFVDDW